MRRWGPAIAAVAVIVGGAAPAVRAADTTGTIIVNLNAMPDGPGDFRFNGAGAEFLLDDDSDPTLPNQQVLSDVQPGFQALTQEPTGDYVLTDASCIDPDGGTVSITNGVNVDVDAGETISCTFTDSQARGNVNIHLDTVPDAPPAVSFTADWGSFTLNDDGSDADALWPDIYVESLPAGTHQLTEGYTEGLAYAGISCDDPDGGTTIEDVGAIVTLDVDPGETIDCTFTNDLAPPTPRAGFHIALDAVPDDPVDVPFQFVDHQFGFTLDDDPTDGTFANAIDYTNADPGTDTYAATIPAGWQVKSLGCVDPDNGSTTDAAKATMTLDLDDGETVSCTLAIEPIPVGPPPGPSCNGKPATIVGKPGPTTIRGTLGPDVIVDLDGDNRIDGRGGNDTICTGSGNDSIGGSTGDDWISSGAGNDRLDGGKGFDICLAGAGSNAVRNCEG